MMEVIAKWQALTDKLIEASPQVLEKGGCPAGKPGVV